MFFKNLVIVAVFTLLITPGLSHAASKKVALAEQRVINMKDYDESSLGSIRIQPPEGWVVDILNDGILIRPQNMTASIGVLVHKGRRISVNEKALDNVKIDQTIDNVVLLEKTTLKLKAASVPYILTKELTSNSYVGVAHFKSKGLQYLMTIRATGEKSWKENRAVMEKSIKTLQISSKATKIPLPNVTTKLAPTFTSNPEISGFKATIRPPLGWLPDELANTDESGGSIGFWSSLESNYVNFKIQLADNNPTIEAREFTRLPTPNTKIAGVPAFKTAERDIGNGFSKQSIYFLKNGSLYVIDIQGTQNDFEKNNDIINKSLKTLNISS